MTSDAERIAARGLPVHLVDGSETRCRFDFRALMASEQRWGSLAATGEALTRVLQASASGWQSAALADLDGITRDTTGRPLEDVDEDLNVYVLLIRAAWEEAFPRPDLGKAEAAD